MPEEAHVLEYIRAINSRQYDELKDEDTTMTTLSNGTGVEKSAERYLRGKNGRVTFESTPTGI